MHQPIRADRRRAFKRPAGTDTRVSGCRNQPPADDPLPRQEERSMLSWALLFLVLGLVAAVFGFTGIAAASAGIAKIIFFVFLVLLVISLVAHAVRGRRPPI